MKTYEILIKAFTTIIVEAEDGEMAMEIAGNNLGSSHGFDIDEYSVDSELKSPESIATAIRHSEWHSHNLEKEPMK